MVYLQDSDMTFWVTPMPRSQSEVAAVSQAAESQPNPTSKFTHLTSSVSCQTDDGTVLKMDAGHSIEPVVEATTVDQCHIITETIGKHEEKPSTMVIHSSPGDTCGSSTAPAKTHFTGKGTHNKTTHRNDNTKHMSPQITKIRHDSQKNTTQVPSMLMTKVSNAQEKGDSTVSNGVTVTIPLTDLHYDFKDNRNQSVHSHPPSPDYVDIPL